MHIISKIECVDCGVNCELFLCLINDGDIEMQYTLCRQCFSKYEQKNEEPEPAT